MDNKCLLMLLTERSTATNARESGESLRTYLHGPMIRRTVFHASSRRNQSGKPKGQQENHDAGRQDVWLLRRQNWRV